MKLKKTFALLLSIVMTLMSISTLNVSLAVSAAGTYQNLSSVDTTSLTIDDFTLDESSATAVETFNVTSSDAGVKLEVTAPVGSSGVGYFILNETLTPDYDSTTVIRFNAVETNKYVQYKPFIRDSVGNNHNITSYITDGSTASVAGGDEIVLIIDWSASTSQMYINGVMHASPLKTFPAETALNDGFNFGIVIASEKATASTLKPRSVTISDLNIWETSADALSCTVEETASGTAQVKFNMPLLEEPVIALDGSVVSATKVDDVTYTIDTSDAANTGYTVSVTAKSITVLTADYTINNAPPVVPATPYRSLLSCDTTSLTADDFTLDADRNKNDATFAVSSGSAGVLLQITAPSTATCGNAYYILDKTFTPSYNSTTVIHFNAVETNKYTQYKPFLVDSDGTRYHITNFVTDGNTMSENGGDEIVLKIDWSASSSQVFRNSEEVHTLKAFPSQTDLSNGLKIGFALSSDKANVTRSFTVSDLNVWETTEDELTCTVESATPDVAKFKFNMPLFDAPVITIDGTAYTATKANDFTYTIDTSDLDAGDYSVSVTAKSVASLDAYETTLTVSNFDPNEKGDAKLTYSNGTLYLTKRPGATILAAIIKAEYNDDDSLESFTVLKHGITGSTSVPVTNAGGVKTKYFVWADDGSMKPLGEPLEIKAPKYTEEYDAPKYTLSKSTDVASANITTKAGQVYYARVYAYGEDSNHCLTLSVKEGDTVTQTFPYFVSTQLAAVYLPFTATGNETSVEVTSEDGGVFYVSDPEIEESNETYHKTKTGTYLIASKDWTYGVVTVNETDGLLDNPDDGDERGLSNNRTMDSIIVGDYMYALRNGRVHVLKKAGDTFRPVYITEFYGELREMDVTKDQKGLVVVARNYGVFAFDITNPEKPVLASHIDSLEMSSGLDIYEDYLYIADRGFGISIFNIKDLNNPRFICNIATGETQNVCYYNGYVYAGVWKESVVRVCDVRDVNNPEILKSIPISGRGDGVLVKDGILYAVTGQHPRLYPKFPELTGAYSHQNADQTGYGLGIGLELWNIENPKEPERLSVVRFDGAEYIGTPDVWRVESYGDKYICATNVYAGAYIYDVSESANPVRVAQYQALGTATPNSIWNNENIFVHQRDPETGNHTSMPLSQNRRAYPVIGITIDGDNDKLYMGTCEYGDVNNLYEVQLDFDIGSQDANSSTLNVKEESAPYFLLDYETKFGENAKYYNSGTQIRAAAMNGDYLYLAAGTEGIIILDKSTMTKVGSVPSLDITKDVQINGKYLYTAEANEGVAIYEINDTITPTDDMDPNLKNSHLKLVGNKPFDQTVVQLQLSPDARYALAHYGNAGAVLDFRDKTAPAMYKEAEAFSMVYQNQMSIGCIGNRYLIMNTHLSKYLLCDFGPNGEYEEPIMTQWTDKTIGASGTCADGEYVILGGGGTKVYRFKPADWDTSDPKNNPFTSQFEVYANYSNMGQCPVILDDYMFVMHRSKGNSRIHKLSEDRKTSTTLKINDGMPANPNMPVSDGERYYLPLGYAGIVSIDMNDLE